MQLPTPSLDTWRSWRPFGVAKRLLSLALTIVVVSSVLALDALADEHQQPADVTAAAVGPIRELAPAAEAADLPVPPSDEYLALVADDVDEVEARFVAYQQRQEEEAAQEQGDEAQQDRRALWFRLADCESGFRRGGTPIPGSARWDYGLHAGQGAPFEGGLQFAPTTWDAFRDGDMPDHAGRATPAQQIVVAERVLAAQGWGAWPLCSRMLGLRS